MIKKFTASNFEGACNVDEDFIKYLNEMNTIVIKHDMIVVITSSYRKDANVKNAIVTPAKMSNHMIGYAIDCNLKNKKTGEYYNSKKMGDGTGADEIFLKEVDEKTELRWGQAFNVPDSVHLDYPLNKLNPVLWQQKYNKIHGV